MNQNVKSHDVTAKFMDSCRKRNLKNGCPNSDLPVGWLPTLELHFDSYCQARRPFERGIILISSEDLWNWELMRSIRCGVRFPENLHTYPMFFQILPPFGHGRGAAGAPTEVRRFLLCRCMGCGPCWADGVLSIWLRTLQSSKVAMGNPLSMEVLMGKLLCFRQTMFDSRRVCLPDLGDWLQKMMNM